MRSKGGGAGAATSGGGSVSGGGGGGGRGLGSRDRDASGKTGGSGSGAEDGGSGGGARGKGSKSSEAAAAPTVVVVKAEAKDAPVTIEFLEAFNGQKVAIEKLIDAVGLATKQITSLSEQSKAAFNPDDIAKISKQLADVITKAQKDAAKGKSLLDALKRDGETLVRTSPKSDRIQPYKAQYVRLCGMYVASMKEHQKAKESLRKVQSDDLVRRGMLIYGDTKSEAEIRRKVEEDPANFVREAIIEEAADEAQAAYAEAQSRARDVEMLVRSLNEVAAMFQDLAVLVQHQSEMLDSIEENVETAGKYVRKGNAALKDAIETQKKTRKCYCCLVIILIIVVIGSIAGVGGFFGVKGG